MTESNSQSRHIKTNYLTEQELARTADLLTRRGRVESSIQTVQFNSKRLHSMAVERFGVRSLADVDRDIVLKLYEALLEDVKPRTAKGYLRDYGTTILANTGRNPVKGTFHKDRLDYQGFLDRHCPRCHDEGLVREYAEDMRKRGIKELTVRHNIALLVSATKCLDELYPDGWRLEDIGQEQLLAMRFHMSQSEKTAKQVIEALVRLIRYATGTSPLRAQLLWNVDDDYCPSRVFITVEDWELMKNDISPAMDLVLKLGALMGLRRAEMCRILIDDISDGMLTIRGKGHGEGKMARMRIPRAVMDSINAYMAVRQRIIDLYGDNSQGHLLIQTSRAKGFPMGPDSISDMVRELGRERGVRVTAHALRRLYATTLHDAGVDLVSIQRMMRHSKMDTTVRCYIDADPRRFVAAQDLLESMLV